MARKNGRKPTPKGPEEISVAPEAEEQPSSPAHSCPVAGFGASAGGLEAFSDVLQHLRADTGLAFVFIQHLDPKHASMLSDLLSRSTKMRVAQATSGMPVEPNHVYVIPPNSNITIKGGIISLARREEGVPHMPIDLFFRSLASEQGSRAIGVVLSGTASDGTLGLKAIKAEGGITFAQSPETAKYDGMPRSAIAAGCVDCVMSPQDIAAELTRLCRHPYLIRERPADTAGNSESDFGEVFAMLRTATGVDFSQYKAGTVRRRTLRRLALHKLETPRQYVDFLREHREELDQLFQDLLINVTGFFREPATFNVIRSVVLPKLFKGRSQDDTLRVWVPGCSSGEEVYSVAITALEFVREQRIEAPIQIFGTDLSEAALQRARAGVYPESIATEVSPEQLRRFFVRADGSYQIARFVRDICVFARQNVTKDPPFSKLDLITCRNLLIYLGPVLQGKAIRLFHYALKPEGYLVLGASEHIGSAGESLFEPTDKQHRIYTRKPTPAVFTADFGAYEERASEAAQRAPVISGMEGHTQVDRMILARYSPPAVVVNRDLQVMQFRGDTSAFLGHPSGEATLDLMRLTRGGIGPEARRLVEKAHESTTPVKSNVLRVATDNEVRYVRISVTPVHGVVEPQFLVVFEPAEAPAQEQRMPKAPGKAKADGERLRGLEQELASTRQYLQSVIEEQEAATEELKSAHEEVQSSNEELQSTNEELLTAKEELQSTNEELTTVNEEMQTRNTELQRSNNDLMNLLSSVNIPIVMLGNDLRIRRFTPQAEKILNLIPADAGRPISDFRLKINIPDIVSLCQEVTDTLAAREREVTDTEGRVYSMWVRPYRTSDNRIEGVVVALVDITERKRTAEARYRRLFEAAKDGIIIADAGTGEIVDSNPYISKISGFSRTCLIGAKYWESDLFRETEVDRSLITELQEREAVQKTLALVSESGERVEVELVASLYAEGERSVIQFNLRDITSRRQLEEQVRRNEAQVRQAQKMEAVGRLAGGVAHDFNNILTAVLGFASLLEEELPDGHAGRPMLQQIQMGTERAVSLTKQLLAFGRKEISSPTVLDPNEVIGGMKQMVSVMLSEDVDLQILLAPDAGRLRADRTQLEQVVLNLVLNARDSIADRGAITVSTSNLDADEAFSERHPAVPVGRYVTITVRDSGSGMDPDTQAHIFEPFFTTKGKGDGAGLGLYTVYTIVKQTGGYVRAFSELGVGSTFTVYLPRVEAEAERPIEREKGERGGTETILLVEDEAPVRVLVRRFLEARGYRVLEAASGPEALNISGEHAGPIHLLLTDVVMPRMSGRELAFQLASGRPDMKVMYMSGHTEDAIIHHGVLDNKLAFLAKPFTRESLLSRVRTVLDESRQETAEHLGQ